MLISSVSYPFYKYDGDTNTLDLSWMVNAKFNTGLLSFGTVSPFIDHSGSFYRISTNKIDRFTDIDDFSTSGQLLVGDGYDNGVNGIYVDPATEYIYVYGNFSTIYTYSPATERTIYSLLRLNYDGTFDDTFNHATTGEIGDIRDLYVQPDGKIVIVGNVMTVANLNGGSDFCSTGARMLRLESDGTIDKTFNYPNVDSDPGVINTILPLPNGNMVLGGTFTEFAEGAYNREVLYTAASGSVESIAIVDQNGFYLPDFTS